MKKLLSWPFVLAVLLCLAGTIDVPYLPQPSGDGYTALQGVCSAPPSLLPAICDHFPLLRQAPGFIERSEKLVEAWMPDIIPQLPAGKGSLIDGIFLKASPRFL